MRSALLAVALLTLGATAGSCPGLPRSEAGRDRYDPCAAKACGDACTACEPGVPGCVEGADLKGCDPSGQCVSWTADLCAPPVATCAGAPCGQACQVEPTCRRATPPCMAPSVAGLCDGDGGCETRLPVGPGFCAPRAPAWGCVGKACGDACGWCPSGADPATCPLETFAPTACDARLQCVTTGTFTCGP